MAKTWLYVKNWRFIDHFKNMLTTANMMKKEKPVLEVPKYIHLERMGICLLIFRIKKGLTTCAIIAG